MAEKKKATNIDERQVIDYLTSNTAFFNEHPRLLNELSLPYKDGKVLSLSQKQVEVLREEVSLLQKKVSHLERKIESLINIVKENERISICLHRLSLTLLHKREVEAIVYETIKTLRAQFPANQIVIRLFSPYSDLSKTARSLDAQDPILKMFLASIFKVAKPDCGPFGDTVKKALFGSFAQRIRSAVVMPLQYNNKKLGLLLFGSPRADAFIPGKGTMILVQFGELISAALAACSQNQTN
ncbi:MAG: DUF484 family protein [Gammaproteobacteria bacterium]|nr:DUF484 family protein [Gammaproteobacteria bacterium]